MKITIVINTNHQIESNITIHTLVLLGIYQNTHSSIVTLISLFFPAVATMFVVSCILFALISIISANTSEVLQQYISIYFNDTLKLRFDEYGFYRTTPKIPIIGTATYSGLLSDLLGCETQE